MSNMNEKNIETLDMPEENRTSEANPVPEDIAAAVPAGAGFG